jgi:hypothetical protein
MRRLALTLILLFAAPVAAQEAGEPQAGAAYAKQCAKCHAIADEDASPEHTAPRFKEIANTSGMTARVNGLASDFAPHDAQYHPRAERREQCGCLYPQPKGLARRARSARTAPSE